MPYIEPGLWSIHNALEMDEREGFVCGDIGCYSLAMMPTGFSTLKTMHAMGSRAPGSPAGLASWAGSVLISPSFPCVGVRHFSMQALPALVNAIHDQADLTMVVLDDSGTAMTGFQPHPGLTKDAEGKAGPALDIARIVRAMEERVEMSDPFDLPGTQGKLLDLLQQGGVNVLILKQLCALSPEKKRGRSCLTSRTGPLRVHRRELRLRQTVHPRL